MRKLLTPLFLFAATLTAHAQSGADGSGADALKLRVLAQQSMPPKWLMRDGQRIGICPDILAAIEKIEPRIDFVGFDAQRSTPAIEQVLEAGLVDAACGLLDNDRRRQLAQVVGPALYTVRHRLAAARGDGVTVRNLDELASLRALVVITRGSQYAAQLRAAGLEVDDSNGDNIVNLKKVAAGHGRFFYSNELSLSWLLQDAAVQGQLRIVPGVLKEDPIYFWISKKVDPATAAMVDRALNKLQASGELVRIYKSWATRAPRLP